ncbi:zinc-finger domain-containing protein [Priestia endophytica]|uniref:zinc-finger domain-containing protein n=1 Tax=Priestia endophytica TaxID=135735 RepID=UPI00203FF70B|nr:zinc-finger domain-containing protein [Priestia endophytica]MCM3536574.1 zinc-finger domain-containing protein [Priestia endophytica]
MDKKERLKTIVRIGDILDQSCKECPKNKKSSTKVNRYCYIHCDLGKELKELGAKLDPSEFTVFHYHSYKARGYLDKEICAEIGMSKRHMVRFKQKHGLIKKKIQKEENA